MEPWFIVLFVVASIAGTALIAFAIKQSGKSREAIKQMAEAEGWQFSYQAAAGGRGSETLIHDPKEGWTVKLYFASSSSSSSSSSTTRWSSFDAPDLAISGLAIIGPDLPEKTKEMAGKMMGMMGGNLTSYILNKFTGGLGSEFHNLTEVVTPGPGTLLATPEAQTALDDARFAPELNNARAGKNEAQQPIVMRGEFGMRIRVTKYLKKPEELKEFIALGRALSDNIRQSA